jgi:hypothetical protein
MTHHKHDKIKEKKISRSEIKKHYKQYYLLKNAIKGDEQYGIVKGYCVLDVLYCIRAMHVAIFKSNFI